MFISLIFIFFKLNKKLNRGNIYNASKYIYYILDHKEQSFFGATSFITVVDARASFVKKNWSFSQHQQQKKLSTTREIHEHFTIRQKIKPNC